MHGTLCLKADQPKSRSKTGTRHSYNFIHFLLTRCADQDEPHLVSPSHLPIFPLLKRYDDDRLDSIGLAGFALDFGTLAHKPSVIRDVFDSLAGAKQSFVGTILFLLSMPIPALRWLPSARGVLISRLNRACVQVARELLKSAKEEEETLEQAGEGKHAGGE